MCLGGQQVKAQGEVADLGNQYQHTQMVEGLIEVVLWTRKRSLEPFLIPWIEYICIAKE